MFTRHLTRLIPISILAVSAVVAHAQISNVAASGGYNNSENAFDIGTNFMFGNDQQTGYVAIAPNDSIASPDTTDDFTNPFFFSQGSPSASSFAFGDLHNYGDQVILSGSGTALSETYANDPWSLYISSAESEDSLSLHLNTAGSVNLELYNTITNTGTDAYNYALYAFAIDGVTIDTSSGDMNIAQALTAGDHTFDVFVMTQAASGGFEPVSGFQNAFADYNLTVTARAVPEPAPVCAFGLGVLGLVLRRRKRCS